MRKLRIFQHISLDGVIQQSADENNFPYPGWTTPYRTPAGLEKLTARYGERYDLLLGRRTYDQWSAFWPTAPSSPMADRLNAAKKHVVTHNAETLAWGPHAAITTGLTEAVRQLKSEDGPDLLSMGSSTLMPTLLASGLVDELTLLVYPVLVGTGKRLFAEGTPPQAFEQTFTDTTATGITLRVFQPTGPLKTT